MGSNGIYWDVLSGKLTKSYGKSPFLTGKSTINGNFQSLLFVYQRVSVINQYVRWYLSFSPPARWGSLDFIRVPSLPSPPFLPPSLPSPSFDTAEPQPPAPDVSGHCRTSTASARCQIECHKECKIECQNIHTYINTYIHTYIHIYIHACMHTYIHTCIHPYIHTSDKMPNRMSDRMPDGMSKHLYRYIYIEICQKECPNLCPIEFQI